MIIISRQGSLGLLYTWTIILLGFGWLWKVFPQLNLDQGAILGLLIILGVLTEWLAVPFPQGYLSGSYVIVLATQLMCGGIATAWVTGLISIIGLGIANRGNPLRTTLFSSAQNVLAVAGASLVYELVTGELLPICLFTFVYFAINHALVYLYLLPGRRDHPGLFGWDALRWDGYTYLVTAPYGAIMAMIYSKLGVSWALLLYLPVLAVQLILRKYVQLELSNRELSALFQVAKGLRVNLDTETFFYQILQESQRVVRFNTGAIFFWSPQRRLFLPGAVQGPLGNELGDIALDPREGLVGQAVQTKESIIINDIWQLLPEEAGVFQCFRSLLIKPLLSQKEVTGVLVLGELQPYAFEDKHIHMLNILSIPAGVVLAHASLTDKIQHLKATDRLTEFLDHRQFYRKLVKEMVRSNTEEIPTSLILVDIDRLRTLNARYGHGVGDAVIQLVASVLRDVTRPTDILGRYGGGELAVLAPGADTAAAIRLAEEIRIEVRDRKLVPEEAKSQVLVTVSLGVATFPQDSTNPDQILMGAEKAVARAKELGRDRSFAYNRLIKQVRAQIEGIAAEPTGQMEGR